MIRDFMSCDTCGYHPTDEEARGGACPVCAKHAARETEIDRLQAEVAALKVEAERRGDGWLAALREQTARQAAEAEVAALKEERDRLFSEVMAPCDCPAHLERARALAAEAQVSRLAGALREVVDLLKAQEPCRTPRHGDVEMDEGAWCLVDRALKVLAEVDRGV